MQLPFKYRYLATLLLAVCLSGFSSCEFEDPDFSEVGNFKLVKMQGQKLDVTLNVTCDNPNKFGFKVKKGTIDLSVNDLKIGIIKLDEKIKIRRKSHEVYLVPLSVDLAPGALIRLVQLAGQKEVTVRMQGKVRGSVWGISKSFDVDESRKVDGSMLKFNMGE